ncbi:MAG TPA: shikimate kinase [Acidimicrobiales bacterium]|nr:shikimate kinase [Acidimicrobiales bacterium]
MSGAGEGGHLLLVGMMGSGKTTVGRLLADRLGWPFFDSDAEVEAATGKSVPEIFEERGEAAFRAAETEALQDGVADGPSVVAVAGGAVLDPANRDLIARSGRVVWLRARPATLVGRVGSGEGRPLLGDDPADALVRLDAVRRPLYAELADEVIDVDDMAAETVAEQVLGHLGAGGGPA